MRKNLPFFIIACSVLLTLYLISIDKEKELKANKIQASDKLEEKPKTAQLSAEEMSLMETIDAYAGSLETKQIAAFPLIEGANLYNKNGDYFSGLFYSDKNGFPLLAEKRETLNGKVAPIKTIYSLKDGKIIRSERKDYSEDSIFVIRETFNYFGKLDSINVTKGQREMYHIGTKVTTFRANNNSPKIDTSIQYLKIIGDLRVAYPAKEVEKVVNSALSRGDFAFKIDTLLNSDPSILKVKTFNEAYFADFEIIVQDLTIGKIQEDIANYKGKIIKIEPNLSSGKTGDNVKNYYKSGTVFN